MVWIKIITTSFMKTNVLSVLSFRESEWLSIQTSRPLQSGALEMHLPNADGSKLHRQLSFPLPQAHCCVLLPGQKHCLSEWEHWETSSCWSGEMGLHMDLRFPGCLTDEPAAQSWACPHTGFHLEACSLIDHCIHALIKQKLRLL